jgi:hypothetical protein
MKARSRSHGSAILAPSSAREETPSLRYARARVASTVRGLMNNRVATSRSGGTRTRASRDWPIGPDAPPRCSHQMVLPSRCCTFSPHLRRSPFGRSLRRSLASAVTPRPGAGSPPRSGHGVDPGADDKAVRSSTRGAAPHSRVAYCCGRRRPRLSAACPSGAGPFRR